jgi:hypothetical protein
MENTDSVLTQRPFTVMVNRPKAFRRLPGAAIPIHDVTGNKGVFHRTEKLKTKVGFLDGLTRTPIR